MKEILFVNSCIRKESRSYMLASRVLSKLEGHVTEVRLLDEDLKPVDREIMQERMDLAAKGDFSGPIFKYARQFKEADEIVIAAPYWDMAFPSLLKIYLEYICAVGLTFSYDEKEQPYGLCRAKRLIYVTTAGSPIEKNMGFDYVRALAEDFFDIEDVVCFKADSLDLAGADVEGILRKTMAEIDSYAF